MDFALGYITGALVAILVLKREYRKLKDFDTWKKWKNKIN